MNDNNKLKIRIQIQQPQQAIAEIYPDLPEPEIVYEESLDWRKISIAVLLLLSVLALIGYFFFGTDQREVASNETAPVIDQTISTQENEIPGEKVALKPEKEKMQLSKINPVNLYLSTIIFQTRHNPGIPLSLQK